MEKAYTKEDFLGFWGENGYLESFAGYSKCGFHVNKETIYNKTIEPYVNNEHVCLEIGCGGGFWTNMLVNKFSKTMAIDVIPKSKLIDERVVYYELSSFDYSCSSIQDNSIDFVWSFGVFCHLPNSAVNEYIKNIIRVLKVGGDAVIMFNDWDTHPMFKNEINRLDYRETPCWGGWFYMYKTTIKKILEENTILVYEDLMPDFRDRIIHFKKS